MDSFSTTVASCLEPPVMQIHYRWSPIFHVKDTHLFNPAPINISFLNVYVHGCILPSNVKCTFSDVRIFDSRALPRPDRKLLIWPSQSPYGKLILEDLNICVNLGFQ